MTPDPHPAEVRIAPRRASIGAHEADALAARALTLIRDRGESVLNAVDSGIYILDAQARTLFVNTAGVRMLGYDSAREMTGQPQHQLIHHSYADGSPFPLEQCPIHLAVTEGIQQEVGGDTFWRRDGRPVLVDYTAIPIREGRSLVGVVVTFHAREQQPAPG